MEIRALSFILTEDCNFDCSYCRQKKEKHYLSKEALNRSIEFFVPYLFKKAQIFFYGGEPLLAFDQIVHAVERFRDNSRACEKEIQFSLSTNGSLIDNRKLEFFERNQFELLISYDGLNQDNSRQVGTSGRTRKILEEVKKYPGINLLINSVYSPETVENLSHSIQSIIESGQTQVRLGLCMDCPWDDRTLDTLERELEKLSGYVLDYWKKTGVIPVSNFKNPPRTPDRPAKCAAGISMLSISPRETIWGCHVFHAYLKNKTMDPDYSTYSFGTLDEFMKNPEEIYKEANSRMKSLRQDFYLTEEKPCFACDSVKKCMSCPVSAAYVTSFIGKIPHWHCRFHRVYGTAKIKFADAFEKEKTQSSK